MFVTNDGSDENALRLCVGALLEIIYCKLHFIKSKQCTLNAFNW